MTARSNIKTGKRVRLRIDTTLLGGFGWITRVDANGFSVTYDNVERAKGQPRVRYNYPWNRVMQFETIEDVAESG